MDIAIVSAGIRFPQARSLATFWQHILAARDLSQSVSAERWPLRAEELTGRSRDHISHDRLYEIEAAAEALLDSGLDPQLLEGLDPLFHLTLGAGQDAFASLASASRLDRRRCGVILGNIALPTAASAARAYQQLRQELGARSSHLPPFAAAVLNNEVAAGPAILLAQALDFGGPAYTIDAACASSLYAIKLAADALESGSLDFVLAGGVSRPHSLYTQVGFSALQALSQEGRCRALDAGADGLLVGEGAGLFGLKRLADAEQAGDSILAVIRGIGLSNDREGKLMAPSSEGQLRAMREAYREADWLPSSIDLVACHATGTPVGDRTEMQSLLQLFAETPQRVVLSSVKPNVGHMLTAAGAASLAEVLMAFAHKTLPPTANFEHLPPQLSGSPLTVLSQAEAWPAPADHPRRAAISGFGFGGINAHLLLEEYQKREASPERSRPSRQRVALVGLAASGPEALDAGERLTDGSWARRELSFGYQQFRIPPIELQESLPQQILALELADRLQLPALPDACLEKAACFVGIELDPMTNLSACRWALEGDRPPTLRHAAFIEWQDQLSPPLNANRVIGALGSIVASRIAREGRLGGPAFTLAAGDASGLQALQLAHESIASGALEAAWVLALDVPSSYRGRGQRAERGSSGESASASDGGLALALMSEEKAKSLGLEPWLLIDAIEREAAPELPLAQAKAGQGSIVALSEGPTVGLQLMWAQWREAASLTEATWTDARGGRWRMRGSEVRKSLQTPLHRPSYEQTFSIERRDLTLEPWLAAAPQPGKADPGHGQTSLKLAPAPSTSASSMAREHEQAPEVKVSEAGAAEESGFDSPTSPAPSALSPSAAAMGKDDYYQRGPLLAAFFAHEQKQIDAHQEFLRYRLEGDALLASLMGERLQGSAGRESEVHSSPSVSPTNMQQSSSAWVRAPLSNEVPLYDYAACQEFARGRIAPVFGPRYAAIDDFPSRVRLPDERLLLCHRVMEIEGEALSLGSGVMITEHDVHADAWYLEGGRMPTSIAVESGQADLMLAAYLGADFHTRGEAVYRLLDARVSFYRDLPQVGETVRYRIEIKRFFEQGGTLFFHFAFEATIGDEPLMSMRDGCAGFFSAAALEAGRGVKRSQLQLDAVRPEQKVDFKPWVSQLPRELDDAALDALRRGAYAEAFGPAFAALSFFQPKGLPGGDLRLVHRIISLEPTGGRFQRGRILGEADIHPDDWFLTCHFVDDQVMPGTLMFECCLHTLRVLLLGFGWVGEESDLHYQPLPGVWSQLKCRGQVLPVTKKVRYDIEIKEIGYDPEPYVICDALMSADGKDIVDISDMSLRLSGLNEAYFEAIWSQVPRAELPAPAYDYEQILAFSSGRPSDCFGPVYTVFDAERKIARLPRPPFQFLDRIDWIEGPFMQQYVGTRLQASYDLPLDAWYWDAEGSDTLPLAVLVEIALQPCGFMAAYMGSALLCERDLSFRNLSGHAQLFEVVRRSKETLSIEVACTKISRSGDMIIQDYSFAVRSPRGLVYEGQTSFGFFLHEALLQQVGLRGVEPWQTPPVAIDRPYPQAAALPRAPLLMVDRLGQAWAPEGRYQGGVLYGEKKVRAEEWFFEAHFYQDPVMPGSLGLQALEQVLKAEAQRIWPGVETWGIKLAQEHRWTYRGQVVPTADTLQYALHLKAIDHEAQTLLADAWLYCDGKPIYAFEELCLSPWATEIKR